jgi:hypothetical protein
LSRRIRRLLRHLADDAFVAVDLLILFFLLAEKP